jgi:hypothetical protein
MPATTETSSTTVALLRRLCDRRPAAIPLSPHPDNGEGVEQRNEGDEHGYQRAVPGTNGPLPVVINGNQSQAPLAWSTSKRLKIRNK